MEFHRTNVSSMPKLALAVRHVHFEDCGSLTEVLLEQNFAIRYLEAGRHPLADVDIAAADLVIGLGGPVAVYDQDKYPWMKHELALLERALADRTRLRARGVRISHAVARGHGAAGSDTHPPGL